MATVNNVWNTFSDVISEKARRAFHGRRGKTIKTQKLTYLKA
jgi:hypothetical protein